MFPRLFRSLIAFGIVMVLYQAYALVAVPLLTPSSVVKANTGAGLPQVSVNPVEKFQKLLSAYFPAGHWSLSGKPIVIESGQMMLVLDDYQRDDSGRVDISRCAVLFFPTPRASRGAPPRDAVIVEAPEGAKLQFDRDFNPARGKVGRIVLGQFPGPITIRSDMREPGAADDLEIITRDLYLSQSLIRTLADVSFRLGPNRGGGRRLEIFLLEEKFRRPGDKDLGITGVKHLEIFENVQFEFQTDSLQLSDAVALAPDARLARPQRVQLTGFSVPLAQANSGAAAWAGGAKQESVYQKPGAAAARPIAAAPVHVNCAGSFRVNFVDLTATFYKRVYATQLSFTGQSDQLTCDELSVRFSSNTQLAPDQDPDFRGTQREALGKLRPVLLRATGEPVRLDSPSRQAHARARTLQVDIDQRQVTLDGGTPQVLQAGNEVTAPVIRYQHPEKGEPAAIGRLWLAGPGRLSIAPRQGDPARAVEARWNQVPGVEFPVQLVRAEGRPVLLVEGRPSVEGATMGSLTCDRMRIAMREVPADGKEGPAIELGGSSPDKLALLPERIDAVGAVVIQSPELTANTHEVTVWVRPVGEQLALG
ncbi:MAG: hypothetical protein KDA37_15830, partial [Planctomycetales bacterium]|nr:hypothetical protein [Planctomycetales bacterium]